MVKGCTIKQRAAALTAILNKQYDPSGGADNVTDILTDLRNLCAVKGWDFFRCDRIARDHASVEQFHDSINTEKIRVRR